MINPTLPPAPLPSWAHTYTGSVIRDLSVVQFSGDAITVQATNVTLMWIDASGNAGNGVVISGPQAVILNSTFLTNAYSGMSTRKSQGPRVHMESRVHTY